ncbi:MAG: hypothetical protein JO182_22715 [Acidobacteriaceae bacterium]|nr:hypothetical protein [Acidobacteriaceae bacterium]
MASFFIDGATDSVYCRVRDGVREEHVRSRTYLNLLWQECAQYIDSGAKKKALRELTPVFWELHLAYSLKRQGKALVPRPQLGFQNNKGPDLFATNPDVWIEAVIATNGTGNDALERPEFGECVDPDIDGVVLRLRSVIRDKSIKFQGYIIDNVIKPGQAIVIAISGLALHHTYKHSGLYPPEIVRAVYPVNHQSIDFNLRTGAVSEPYLQYRNRIDKLCGASVLTDVFLDPDFAFISAVLYSEADWGGGPERAGMDFVLVHNTSALTPLPDSWMPVGDEYWWRDGQLYRQHHNEVQLNRANTDVMFGIQS